MLFCHGCGKTYTHSHGAGLYCSAGCEGETKTRQAVEEEKLKAKGFTQHADAPHTWTKDGVSIPIELVIRQGHENVVAIHAEAVRTIASGKFAN